MTQPMNVVNSTPYPCPGCGKKDCKVAIYERLAIRECNHTHAIPPIHKERKRGKACGVRHD